MDIDHLLPKLTTPSERPDRFVRPSADASQAHADVTCYVAARGIEGWYRTIETG
jgi:hypothetical protein